MHKKQASFLQRGNTNANHH